MGQSDSSHLKEHLAALHQFDSSVLGMKDELLGLIKRHYDHCSKESVDTGRNCHIPLPECKPCSEALAKFHDHVHHFHEKLK
jgi:hypothetical protein